MEKSFYCEGRLDSREDYELFDNLKSVEKRKLTDSLDDLLLNPDFRGLNLSDVTCDQNGIYLSKQYDLGQSDIDDNESSINKQITVYYDRTAHGLSIETYEIIVSYTVNQLAVEKKPIITRYEISYFGSTGQSSVASVESLDLTDGFEDNRASPDLPTKSQLYTTRKMTAYDYRQIEKSLSELTAVFYR